jgi:hydrogen peroxide-dependent heme synthase
MKARDINSMIRYTMWSVFKKVGQLDDPPLETANATIKAIEGAAEDDDLVIRGWYDVAGLRADADLMVWWHAADSDTLQDAYHALRRSDLGNHLRPVWSQLALHRPAEFNKGNVPAFMQDEEPKAYLSVYPFVRSYEWYLLPEEERRAMLTEHGMMARPYPDVRANTVASFALGDYEWMLAFEADELHRIVDLMRALRAAAARRHTREEVPFYTGRRRELSEILALW